MPRPPFRIRFAKKDLFFGCVFNNFIADLKKYHLIAQRLQSQLLSSGRTDGFPGRLDECTNANEKAKRIEANSAQKKAIGQELQKENPDEQDLEEKETRDSQFLMEQLD